MPDLFRVTAVIERCEGVKSFRLARLDRKPVAPFEPGAHLTLTLNDASSGVRGTRAYTITSQPHDTAAYEVTIADSGAGLSGFFHSSVKPGRVVQVASPVQGFGIPPGECPLVLVAGGIGITPLYSMACELARGQRPYRLYYSGKAAGRMPFLDELRVLAGDRLEVRQTQAGQGRWSLDALLASAPAGAHACVCGPEEMLGAAVAAAAKLGWEAARVHLESFAGVSHWDDQPFTVELGRSARTVQVQPGQSVLDALLAVGITVDYDCRQGTCGRCTQRVLGGEPDHKDLQYAGSGEEGWIRVCVSRSRGPVLKLDL